MHHAIRPYVTTGVALVGASVIAAAPLQPVVPADIQIPNPAVQAVERGVQLTANEIQTAVNNAIFTFVARPTVAGAELLGRLLEPLIGEEQATLLPIAALGFAGPLISGGGSVGTALQEIVDSEGFEDLLNNLIGAVGTITDGSVNGGYGPDLVSLVAPILFPTLPEALWPEVLAGGFISEQITEGVVITSPPYFLPTFIQLPGTIPTLQELIGSLFGSDMASASLLAAAPAPRPIEDGVNELLYAATALTLRIATLAAPLVAPILDVTDEEAAQFLAIGTLGFIGPLIGGAGGAGHALQDLVDSDDFADFLDNSLDLVRLPIDGAVNGGHFGPNLAPLLPFLPAAIPLVTNGCAAGLGTYCKPVEAVYAPGLIQNADYDYTKLPGGLGLQTLGGSPTTLPDGFNITTVGTIPTLQGLVGRVFDSLPSASAASQSNLKVAGGDEGKAAADDQKVEPKKRNRPLLNLLKDNPLAGGTEKPGDGTAKHLPGLGKHPVRDIVNRVLGGGDDDKDVKAVEAAS